MSLTLSKAKSDYLILKGIYLDGHSTIIFLDNIKIRYFTKKEGKNRQISKLLFSHGSNDNAMKKTHIFYFVKLYSSVENEKTFIPSKTKS